TLATPVDPERRADPYVRRVIARQVRAISVGLVCETLGGRAARQPPLGDTGVAPEGLLGGEREGHDRFKLLRVTDDHHAPGPPDRPRRCLWSGLTRFVDEQPAERFPAELGEDTRKRGERRRDHRDHEKQALPRG